MRRNLYSVLLTAMATALLFISGATSLVTTEQPQELSTAMTASESCDATSQMPAGASSVEEPNGLCPICPLTWQGCTYAYCTTKHCCYTCPGGGISCFRPGDPEM
jgi:hypothetical protein